jgi:hypothetical protein
MVDMSKPKSQIEEFRKAARGLECDESEGRFDATLGKIARAPVRTDKELADLARKVGQTDPNESVGKAKKKR